MPFDVNIPVVSRETLNYLMLPENDRGRNVAVELIMTDGSTLRDSGATNSNSVGMHPGIPKGTVGTYTQIECLIGSWLNGKTIDKILIGYDNATELGDFVTRIDDIEISD